MLKAAFPPMARRAEGGLWLECSIEMNFKTIASIILISLISSSCTPNFTTPTNSTPTQAATESSPSTPTPIPPEPTKTPSNINPLTGLPVPDASLLDLPALLVSISHFPATARPQAGLSFAPFVFEIYITEGATRFLTTFYGELPAPEVPLAGNCDVRTNPFTQTDMIVGNQVWHDANGDGIHEVWERGIEGVCVNLYDADLNLLQQTTTDTNGYYGFNVSPGKYFVAVAKPDGMEFAQKNVGDEEQDSDVDQATGWTDALDITTSSLLNMDVGLIPHELPPPTSRLAPAKVGPVRSGRLIYADIADFFPDSCLIYAFASAEVLVHLPKCFFVNHDIQGGGYMLSIDEMMALVQHRAKKKIDYTSNIFSDEPPEGGVPASRLDVFTAWLNQSAWVYDPLYQSWWRYVDTSEESTAGKLHAEVDRLTLRQLHFENVIVLYTTHDVISPTNLDIHLEQNRIGEALLFRDGQKYRIRWSTQKTEQEKQADIRKPIRFYYHDTESLFPLKPGHTWIIVVTPETTVTEKEPGEWFLRFIQPAGAK
jgi:hypothetical protein